MIVSLMIDVLLEGSIYLGILGSLFHSLQSLPQIFSLIVVPIEFTGLYYFFKFLLLLFNSGLLQKRSWLLVGQFSYELYSLFLFLIGKLF